jgi:hypothetical protein
MQETASAEELEIVVMLVGTENLGEVSSMLMGVRKADLS